MNLTSPSESCASSGGSVASAASSLPQKAQMALNWDRVAGFVPFLANASQLQRLWGVFRTLAFVLATLRIIFFSTKLPAAE